MTLAEDIRPTPEVCQAPVLVNRPRTEHYRQLRLTAPSIAASAQPGQFVMLTAQRAPAGHVLPRPMAIFTRDARAGTIDIVYRLVGAGTHALATFAAGEHMTVVGPLGRGFVLDPQPARVLLVGRGIGICSLTAVAQDLAAAPVDVFAVASARDPGSLIGAEVFRDHGARALWSVTDAEGTSAPDRLRDRLHAALDDQPPGLILTCGSRRLAKLCVELGERWDAEVQESVEAHMACGLGYCHGCASGPPSESGGEPTLVCRDGPVFRVR